MERCIAGTAQDASLFLGDRDNRDMGRITYNNANNNLELWSNGTQQVTIDNNGDVGIGTDNPGALLTIDPTSTWTNPTLKISGSGTDTAVIQLDRSSTGRWGAIDFSTSGATDWHLGHYYDGGSPNSKFGIGTDHTAANMKFVIDTNGNVGIGTDASGGKLEIANSTSFNPAANVTSAVKLGGSFGGGLVFADTAYAGIWTVDNGQTLAFASNGTSGGFGSGYGQMVLKNGNVGIGNSSPGAKLDVAGNIKVGSNSATCDIAHAGEIRWNGADFEGCDGNGWESLTAVAPTTKMLVNNNHSAQYCLDLGGTLNDLSGNPVDIDSGISEQMFCRFPLPCDDVAGGGWIAYDYWSITDNENLIMPGTNLCENFLCSSYPGCNCIVAEHTSFENTEPESCSRQLCGWDMGTCWYIQAEECYSTILEQGCF